MILRCIFRLAMVICLLLPVTGYAQTAPVPREYKRSYLSVKVPLTVGSDMTASDVIGTGIHVSRRNYKPASLQPGAGISMFIYNDEAMSFDRVLLIEGMGIANLQIVKIMHLRLTGTAGVQMSQSESQAQLTVGAAAGAGITLWRLEAAVDMGVKTFYYEDPYLVAGVSLSYVFSKNRDLLPR